MNAIATDGSLEAIKGCAFGWNQVPSEGGTKSRISTKSFLSRAEGVVTGSIVEKKAVWRGGLRRLPVGVVDRLVGCALTMARKSVAAAAIAIMASASAADDHKFLARRRVGTSRDLRKERGLPDHASKGTRRRHLRRGGRVMWSVWPFFGHLIPKLLYYPDQITDEEAETGVEAMLGTDVDGVVMSMPVSSIITAGAKVDMGMSMPSIAEFDIVDFHEPGMSMPSEVVDTPSPEDIDVDIPEPVEVSSGVSNDVPLFFGKRRVDADRGSDQHHNNLPLYNLI